MVKLMRCGQCIHDSMSQLIDSDINTTCPLCETHYDQGPHRPCIDICSSEKCLSCIINVKECPACLSRKKLSQSSQSPSTSSFLGEVSTLLKSEETTPQLSPKKEEETIIIKEVDEKVPKSSKKLIGQSLGEGFPENVRYIPGVDRRRYYCTICESRWTTRQNKKAHDHGKPKPFRCHLCTTTKDFTERSHYNYHMKATHGINNKPVRKSSKISRSKRLTRHVKLFKSRQLQKAMLSSIQKSVRSHSQVKPYKCPRCQARFTRKDNMNTHLLRNICKLEDSK